MEADDSFYRVACISFNRGGPVLKTTLPKFKMGKQMPVFYEWGKILRARPLILA